MYSIGKKIEELRKKFGITQEELGFAVDVSRQAIYQWEADITVPKADKLKALCEYFNVRPDYFLFENSAPEPLANSTEETAAAIAENEETKPEKGSRKKNVLITWMVITSVLAVAMILFIALLVSPAAASELSEYVIICLLILACVILLTVLSVLFALIVKYKRNT